MWHQILNPGTNQVCLARMQTLISLTAMYETARLQGRPAPNAAEFNTYAFIMLLVGRQKDAATHFFQVPWKLPLERVSLKALALASSTMQSA